MTMPHLGGIQPLYIVLAVADNQRENEVSSFVRSNVMEAPTF